MKVNFENNNIILTDTSDFNLHHVFECGQAFRWNTVSDNTYVGVAKGHALRLSQAGDKITLYNTSLEDFQGIWYNYFDLGTDYSKIKKLLSRDEVLRKAIPYGSGIRILKQDLWEVVVSFIISASNNIPRIKKIIDTFCESFGDELVYENKTYYTFPNCEKVSNLSLEDLSVIRAGFRDKYILEAAKMFASGTVSEQLLEDLDTQSAKKSLLSIYGVGSKVADCILLFGLGRTDAFPVDVWISRIMEELYLKRSAKKSEIEKFAYERFGELSGIAQQYLFFYARENFR